MILCHLLVNYVQSLLNLSLVYIQSVARLCRKGFSLQKSIWFVIWFKCVQFLLSCMYTECSVVL